MTKYDVLFLIQLFQIINLIMFENKFTMEETLITQISNF